MLCLAAWLGGQGGGEIGYDAPLQLRGPDYQAGICVKIYTKPGPLVCAQAHNNARYALLLGVGNGVGQGLFERKGCGVAMDILADLVFGITSGGECAMRAQEFRPIHLNAV